ncbi:MAG: family 43 glycosylhydrolase [Prevotellaceae bacterium]|nr:family 43 glycosylhydrolase [Prevotellaceae bacterium]
MKTVFTLLLLAVSLSMGAKAQPTWTNPLTLPNEWPLYGIGDPYILKYRGVYYLYCSTRDNMTGVKCWSTKDFITWSDAYTCTSASITKSAYAPEVVYWNGLFYMYTSPAGNGHYVLTSSSPTGPFTAATGNVGKSIDGSIFIEDDGKWYFYHASDNGIQGCAMSSPTSIGADVNLNTRMGYGWTEGPTVIKRNGTYYLIYTGNHVISRGYRIDYAQNTAGPIAPYTPQSNQNPILIKTEGEFVGLGHGSAFVGPDLDSYYYTYHNLAGDYGVGPYRRLNFDRIAWNGAKLLLLGPTTWPQQAFRQADMADFFDRDSLGANWLTPNGGSWTVADSDRLMQNLSDNESATPYKALLNQPTKADYTAEFTMKEEAIAAADARFGAVFGYTDEANYGMAVLNSASNRLEVSFKANNKWDAPRYANLPSGYNLRVWHHLRLEKSGASYRFYIDGMLKLSASHALGGGKIGYATDRCQANFGYIALHNQANGSGIFDVHKPIPGIIAAVHYNSGGEGVAYHDLTAGNSDKGLFRNDSVDIGSCSEGGFAITANQSGEWYKYNVNVKATGLYHLGLRYSATDSAQIRIRQGSTDLTGRLVVPATSSATNWRTLTIKGLELQAGWQTLTVETLGGSFNFYEMRFEEADNSVVTQADSFDTAFSPLWNYSDGTWNISSGAATINGHGKRTLGSTGWTDYTVQVDVTYYSSFNAGLIFRVNNPALGGAGKDPALGTDYLQAYYVTLSASSLILGKQSYNWQQLATKAGAYIKNRKYTLKVEVNGSNIKIYVDNMKTPQIDYTDPRPFICGKVGLRVCNDYASFDNFSVTTHPQANITLPEKNTTPPPEEDTTKTEVLGNGDAGSAVRLFPNPAADELTVHNVADFSDLFLYRADGQEIDRKKISGPACRINTSSLSKGLYLIKLISRSEGSVVRKFVKQ